MRDTPREGDRRREDRRGGEKVKRGKGDAKDRKGSDDNNLYIKGLPSDMTEDRLRGIVGKFGKIVSCKVLPVPEGKKTSAAFVRTKTAEQAQKCVKGLNNQVPDGLDRQIRVQMAGEHRDKDRSRADDGRDAAEGTGKGKGKGKAKPKGGGDKQKETVSLFVGGLPVGSDEEAVKGIFSQYAEVLSVKVLAALAGKPTVAAFVRVVQEDADWLVKNLNDEVPGGMTQPISVSLAENDGKGGAKGGGGKCGGKGAEKGKGVDKGKGGKGKGKGLEDLLTDEVEESDNLFVKGLPGDMDEDTLRQLFSQYGTVISVKVLQGGFSDGKPSFKTNGFVRMSTVAEAKNVIEQTSLKPPMGLDRPVTVKFEGDGVSRVQKAVKKMQAGSEMFLGRVSSYNNEQKVGFIQCDDIYHQTGKEVCVHGSVLESAKAGPGDSVVFFVFWKGDLPQAQRPMIRVAADCTSQGEMYALRGWFKGPAGPEKPFGFAQCAELKVLFNKDVYVGPQLAGTVQPGWVALNVLLRKDLKLGGVNAQATHIGSCDENWKPTPGDLSRTWAAPAWPGGGWAAGGKGYGAAAPPGAGAVMQAIATLGGGRELAQQVGNMMGGAPPAGSNVWILPGGGGVKRAAGEAAGESSVHVPQVVPPPSKAAKVSEEPATCSAAEDPASACPGADWTPEEVEDPPGVSPQAAEGPAGAGTADGAPGLAGADEAPAAQQA